MKSIGRPILVLGIILGLVGCGNRETTPPPSQTQQQVQQPVSQPASPSAEEASIPQGPFQKVRGPAVAGMFYPRDKDGLIKAIDGYLAAAKPEEVKNLRGLVCPHAGYEFSGPVAAYAYKLLPGRDIRTVIVMAPSHNAAFRGAMIPDADAYETPLGMVPVAPLAQQLVQQKPFEAHPQCEVRRPGWWRQAPKELPAFGEDTPDTWEHSLEVQLPFLQRTLKRFSLVPIVFGDVDTEAVGRALAKVLDDRTLLVASSDLSHYMPYETAQGLDATCVKAICSLNAEWVARQEACGKGPIAALVYVAQQKGWKARLLDCRNSGDITGDKSRGVVGYAAIAFYQPDGAAAPQVGQQQTPPPAAGQDRYTPEQRKYLLELARKAVTVMVRLDRLPEVAAADVPQGLTEPRAVFVTLTEQGKLRGCIGDIFPRQPLYQAVVGSAASAAVRDHRFRPVIEAELDDIKIEVSVLTVPQRLEFKTPAELLEKLRPGVDGVVLRVGSKSATYLPQVWEQIPDKRAFLNNLAEKAGLAAPDWMSEGASVLVYQVEAFHEAE